MRYDYILVGAGSAGCVLAHRLSASGDARVLLLEAGGRDKNQAIHIPAAFSKLFKTDADWAYETEPQEHMDGRRLYWPRGKVLGGSSSINAMIYIRGHRSVYDAWAEAAGPGWSYDAILPYHRRAENLDVNGSEHGPTAADAERFHGTGGPLNVTVPRSPRRLALDFVDAASEVLGLPRNRDFNGAEQEGVGLYHLTQKNGRRHSAATAYLKPALGRPNLTVTCGAHVTAVTFDGTRATGVTYLREGREERAEAAEVVLCGGAINSPQLLLLSGVGPAADLGRLGIPVVSDLPGVGENLQDHLMVTLNWECKQPVTLWGADSLPNLLRFLFLKRGPLTSNVAEAGGFLKTDPGQPCCDLQFHFAPSYYVDNGFGNPEGHGFAMAPTLVGTKSRGRLWLRSRDPLAAPAIDPRYLEDEADLEVLVRGVELGRAIVESPVFDAYRGREVYPEDLPRDGEGLRQAIRRTAATIYHPVGTCAMGRGERAVVDAELRVRGVEGLRVADASVMPVIVNGNTNAATIAIAEKASDLMLG